LNNFQDLPDITIACLNFDYNNLNELPIGIQIYKGSQIKVHGKEGYMGLGDIFKIGQF